MAENENDGDDSTTGPSLSVSSAAAQLLGSSRCSALSSWAEQACREVETALHYAIDPRTHQPVAGGRREAWLAMVPAHARQVVASAVAVVSQMVLDAELTGCKHLGLEGEGEPLLSPKRRKLFKKLADRLRLAAEACAEAGLEKLHGELLRESAVLDVMHAHRGIAYGVRMQVTPPPEGRKLHVVDPGEGNLKHYEWEPTGKGRRVAMDISLDWYTGILVETLVQAGRIPTLPFPAARRHEPRPCEYCDAAEKRESVVSERQVSWQVLHKGVKKEDALDLIRRAYYALELKGLERLPTKMVRTSNEVMKQIDLLRARHKRFVEMFKRKKK